VDDDRLLPVSQKIFDPLICFTCNAVAVEFVDKEAVVDLVKCFREIENYDICLGGIVKISCDLIC